MRQASDATDRLSYKSKFLRLGETTFQFMHQGLKSSIWYPEAFLLAPQTDMLTPQQCDFCHNKIFECHINHNHCYLKFCWYSLSEYQLCKGLPSTSDSCNFLDLLGQTLMHAWFKLVLDSFQTH